MFHFLRNLTSFIKLNKICFSDNIINKNKIYCKITNHLENHKGYQYKNGLNVIKDKFNDDKNDKCGGGGFYFSDLNDILHYHELGNNLRIVELPFDDKDFKVIKIGNDKEFKYRSNKIILRNKFTFENREELIFLKENIPKKHEEVFNSLFETSDIDKIIFGLKYLKQSYYRFTEKKIVSIIVLAINLKNIKILRILKKNYLLDCFSFILKGDNKYGNIENTKIWDLERDFLIKLLYFLEEINYEISDYEIKKLSERFNNDSYLYEWYIISGLEKYLRL